MGVLCVPKEGKKMWLFIFLTPSPIQNMALYADVSGKQFPVTRGQDVGRYQVRATESRVVGEMAQSRVRDQTQAPVHSGAVPALAE